MNLFILLASLDTSNQHNCNKLCTLLPLLADVYNRIRQHMSNRIKKQLLRRELYTQLTTTIAGN